MSNPDKDQNMTASKKHTTLKEMLEQFKPEERYSMITNYDDALISGVVQGVPLKDSSFEIQFQNEQGKVVNRKIQNEHLIDTQEMRAWFASQAAVSRKLIAESTGHFELSESEAQGDAALTQLFIELRRKALTAKRKAEQQAKKDSPTSSARAEAKLKKTRKPKTDKPKKSPPVPPQITPDESASGANLTNGNDATPPELADAGANLTTSNSTETADRTEQPGT